VLGDALLQQFVSRAELAQRGIEDFLLELRVDLEREAGMTSELLRAFDVVAR
jgi:hypothetical protein